MKDPPRKSAKEWDPKNSGVLEIVTSNSPDVRAGIGAVNEGWNLKAQRFGCPNPGGKSWGKERFLLSLEFAVPVRSNPGETLSEKYSHKKNWKKKARRVRCPEEEKKRQSQCYLSKSSRKEHCDRRYRGQKIQPWRITLGELQDGQTSITRFKRGRNQGWGLNWGPLKKPRKSFGICAICLANQKE